MERNDFVLSTRCTHGGAIAADVYHGDLGGEFRYTQGARLTAPNLVAAGKLVWHARLPVVGSPANPLVRRVGLKSFNRCARADL